MNFFLRILVLGFLFGGGLCAEELPFLLNTAGESFPVDLIRREGETVWIKRKSSTGTFFESGVLVSQIRSLQSERPRLFTVANEVDNQEDSKQIEVALTRLVRRYEDFRDLPGVPVDEAVYEHGMMLSRFDQWTRALKRFEDILNQSYPSAFRQRASMGAGLALIEIGDYEAALEHLNPEAFPTDQVSLFSRAWFARGRGLYETGLLDEAVQAFLYPVVFHPYVDRNEVKGLLSVLPVYAALQDWDAVDKTLLVLKTQYPNQPETVNALDWAKPYAEHLENEQTMDTGLDPAFDTPEEGNDV